MIKLLEIGSGMTHDSENLLILSVDYNVDNVHVF
jgi:hypothetical protein